MKKIVQYWIQDVLFTSHVIYPLSILHKWSSRILKKTLIISSSVYLNYKKAFFSQSRPILIPCRAMKSCDYLFLWKNWPLFSSSKSIHQDEEDIILQHRAIFCDNTIILLSTCNPDIFSKKKPKLHYDYYNLSKGIFPQFKSRYIIIDLEEPCLFFALQSIKRLRG